MNSYSTTQSTNLVAIVGVLVMVLNHFGINVASDELTAVIGAGMTIYGVVANWYHRYQKGDLTALGFRKY